MKIISSRQNPYIQKVTKLSRSAKERTASGRCIVEGVRTLTTALSGKIKLDTIITTEKQQQAAEQLAPPEQIVLVTEPVMEKMSTMTTPPGILGVCIIPPEPEQKQVGPGLVLADIADPGNMGTLIRTAAACRVSSVVVVEGVDPWSPKVIAASVGTISLVQLYRLSWESLVATAHQNDLVLCGLTPHNGKKISSIDPAKSLIIVGNEARGIRKTWLADCEELITLAMPGGTESLNAAVAGSIAVYLSFCPHS